MNHWMWFTRKDSEEGDVPVERRPVGGSVGVEIDRRENMQTEGSSRSRAVALALGGILGIFGAHRFYVGKTGTGILMLCTFGGLGIWWVHDMILLSAGSFRDKAGRRVVHWTESEADEMGREGDLRTEMWDEIYSLREELNELTERVDFTERLLTRKSREFDSPQRVSNG